MYHVSAQGVDEHMIYVHYYYYNTVITLITILYIYSINLVLCFYNTWLALQFAFHVPFDCFSDILVTNIKMDMTYVDFCTEIKDICKFDDCQPFTVKWLDEEGQGLCGVVYKYGLQLQGKLQVLLLCSC